MTKGFMDNLTALGSSRSRATFCSRQKPNRTVVLGDNSGRILDLSIYDCNMKIGPARRCSSPHRPILGPTSLGDERQLRPCSLLILLISVGSRGDDAASRLFASLW